MEYNINITICRICINEIEAGEKLFNLFEKYEDLFIPGMDQDDILIVDKINALANVDITNGDGLPSSVCSNCLLELEEAYNFKRKCEKSDDVLRLSYIQNIGKSEVDVPIKQEDECNSEENASGIEYCLSEKILAKSEDLEAYASDALNDTNYSDEETSQVEFQQNYSDPDNEEKSTQNIFLEKCTSINGITANVGKKRLKNDKSERKFQCEHCDECFISECKLRVHLKMTHSIYTCSVCKEYFKSYGALRNHREKKNCYPPIATNKPAVNTKMSMNSNLSTTDLCINSGVKKIYMSDNGDDTTDNLVKPSKAIDLKLECHDCGNFFKSKCKMRVHWKTAHSAFICPSCKRSFKTYSAYKNHQRLKSIICRNASKMRVDKEGGVYVFYCKSCDFNTKARGSMVQHFVVHSERSFQCDLCPKSFIRQCTLTFHRESVHNQYTHAKTCPICNLVILGSSKYKYHMKKHKDYTFQCDICQRTYTDKEYLKSHMLQHMYKKTHPCNVCNKMFYTKNLVAYHKKQFHEREMHCCTICGYSLFKLKSIAEHEKKHTKDNVSCNLCGKFFDNSTQMSLHMEKHLNKTKHCAYCDKSFLNRNYLSNHVRKEHNIFVSKGDVGKVKAKQK